MFKKVILFIFFSANAYIAYADNCADKSKQMWKFINNNKDYIFEIYTVESPCENSFGRYQFDLIQIDEKGVASKSSHTNYVSSAIGSNGEDFSDLINGNRNDFSKAILTEDLSNKIKTFVPKIKSTKLDFYPQFPLKGRYYILFINKEVEVTRYDFYDKLPDDLTQLILQVKLVLNDVQKKEELLQAKEIPKVLLDRLKY